MKSVDKSKITGFYGISELCLEYDLTRDAYYKYQKRFVKQENVKQKVISLIKERRDTLSRKTLL